MRHVAPSVIELRKFSQILFKFVRETRQLNRVTLFVLLLFIARRFEFRAKSSGAVKSETVGIQSRHSRFVRIHIDLWKLFRSLVLSLDLLQRLLPSTI